MDQQEEYHDPDYPGVPAEVKDEPPSVEEDEKEEKIKSIIRREFSNELEERENEIMLIDQRMSSSRRLLHRLRYAVVNSYYHDQKLQLTGSQIQDEVAAQHEPRARNEVASVLREGQRRLHPSVRKLLGKQTVDLEDILFRSRSPRAKSRKDYSAMVQSRNYTIAADTTKSLRPGGDPEVDPSPSTSGPSKPTRKPRHINPCPTKVLTLDEATRNQTKNRYRLIIGNTSKYAPAASALDRSTHKWLLYVRGPKGAPDASALLRAVALRLHHSYAPHHNLTLTKPPFQVSRRGWGEFPARVELHFPLPARNRPATVTHTIKLDRNYTGLQTLGAETVVDVWLYSTPEMLKYEYKEDIQSDIKLEPPSEPEIEPVPEPKPEPEPVQENVDDRQTDNWLDFFSNTTALDVDEMIIRPEKKKEETIEEDVPEKENHVEEIEGIKVENDVEEVPEEYNWADKVYLNNTEHPSDELPSELLTQPTWPKKRIMKYMDPATGKIYYLEMDRTLDLSKVQEIVINSKGNVKTAKISPIRSNGLKNVRKNAKKGVSLLKPEVQSLLKKEDAIKTEKPQPVIETNYAHIENDHCYLGSSKNASFQVTEDSVLPVDNVNSVAGDKIVVKKEKSLFETLCSVMSRFNCVRVAVNYLLKKIPIISDEVRDPDFVKCFPFAVETEEKYWKLDFAKRRNIEWSRAKLINKMLQDMFVHNEPLWRTKQILIYSRLHGFYPVRTEAIQRQPDQLAEWSSWTDFETIRRLESNIKSLYPTAADICSLTKFDASVYLNQSVESIELSDSDEEIEVVKCVQPVTVKKEVDMCSELTVLPVESEEDRLRFLFVERKCADIGIELRNEDVGNGYCYSAVHAVLASAARCFAEELVRSALAHRLQADCCQQPPPVWTGSSSSRTPLPLEHVVRALRTGRLRALSAHALAAERTDTHYL